MDFIHGYHQISDLRSSPPFPGTSSSTSNHRTMKNLRWLVFILSYFKSSSAFESSAGRCKPFVGSHGVTQAFHRRHQSPSTQRYNQCLLSSVASSDTTNKHSVSVGFIGFGTIAQAIATGLVASSIKIKHMAITERSRDKSQVFQDAYGDTIPLTVCTDNQQILNQSDIVFVTVLPQQLSQVLGELEWNPAKHVVVSLVSTASWGSLVKQSGLPASQVYKMICLPAVKHNQGMCLVQTRSDGNITPTSDNRVLELCKRLGGYIVARSDEEMSALMVTAGLMGPFYGILRNNYNFLVQKGGIQPQDATLLIVRLYQNMIQDAVGRTDESALFDTLVKEQTPGGLNEQALDNMIQLGVLETSYDRIQRALLSRIRGESDGSMGIMHDED